MARKKLLRWAGSKAGAVATLSRHLDFTRDYIEPFAGSAVLFFRHLPKNAYLNDINSKLIDLYRHLRDDPDYIWHHYNRLDSSSETYYLVRDRYNSMRASKLRSSLFLFLNHHCFNGIYRTNSSGAFNTPFGGDRLPSKFSRDEINQISQQLRNVELYSSDFETFLAELKPENASIFMDPPYYTIESRVFREYGPGVFSSADLARLHTICVELAVKGNKVVVTYQDCMEFRSLFSTAIVDDILTIRNVGGFADRRKTQRELIAVF